MKRQINKPNSFAVINALLNSYALAQQTRSGGVAIWDAVGQQGIIYIPDQETRDT